MNMRLYLSHIPQMQHWLVMALAFCLPLSTSAVTVIALMILFLWIVNGGFQCKLQEIAANPICRALLVYVGVMVLGIFWSDSWQEGLGVIQHRWKILFVPILLTSIRWEQRSSYVTAFLVGVVVTVVVIDLAYLGTFNDLGLTNPNLSFDTIINQMVSTPMLALAIYLLIQRILSNNKRGGRHWLLWGLSCCLSLNIFIMRGRAGLFVFVLLIFLLSFQYFRNRIVVAFVIPALIVPVVLAGAYYASPVFQLRMKVIPGEIESLREKKETSVGLRLHYWYNSWRLIKQHPCFGVGTGDFASSYKKINQQYTPEIGATNNPHNQYIFVTAQLGIVGLFALLGMFLVFFREASRRQDSWEMVRVAFPLFFMTIMLSESYLDITGTGFLFSLFGALLFKYPPSSLKSTTYKPCGHVVITPLISDHPSV